MKNVTILIIDWIIIVICSVVLFAKSEKQKNTYYKEGSVIGAVMAIIYSYLMIFKEFPIIGWGVFVLIGQTIGILIKKNNMIFSKN
ncbi:MAG: hypothetical protein IJ068_00660 [Bacilli bacterium]|nr:hypothetical protein [Bacilli bacterium]